MRSPTRELPTTDWSRATQFARQQSAWVKVTGTVMVQPLEQTTAEVVVPRLDVGP
jgi:hypothetical protein